MNESSPEKQLVEEPLNQTPEKEDNTSIPSYSFTNMYSGISDNDDVKIEEKPKEDLLEEKDKSEEKDLLEEKDKSEEKDLLEEKDQLTELPKELPKEIVKIEKDNDIDETSTLVNFFEDMKQIVVDKGIKVENNEESYNLFDDANEV